MNGEQVHVDHASEAQDDADHRLRHQVGAAHLPAPAARTRRISSSAAARSTRPKACAASSSRRTTRRRRSSPASGRSTSTSPAMWKKIQEIVAREEAGRQGEDLRQPARPILYAYFNEAIGRRWATSSAAPASDDDRAAVVLLPHPAGRGHPDVLRLAERRLGARVRRAVRLQPRPAGHRRLRAHHGARASATPCSRWSATTRSTSGSAKECGDHQVVHQPLRAGDGLDHRRRRWPS